LNWLKSRVSACSRWDRSATLTVDSLRDEEAVLAAASSLILLPLRRPAAVSGDHAIIR
jgi:hypothetical protein